MKKTQHKIPSSLFKTRVENAVKEHLKVQVISPDQHDALRSELNKATGQIDNLTLEVAGYKQQISEQAKRHQTCVTELKDKIEQQAKQLVPILGVSSYGENHNILVRNWQTAWKWISTWALGLIGYIAIFGIPQEVISLFPEAYQMKIIGVIALIGFVGRFVNQSKPKPLPPVTEDL